MLCLGSDKEDAAATPPRKKVKIHYNQKVRKEWLESFPCFTTIKGNDGAVYCTDCKSNINIMRGSIKQLEAHVATKKHKKNAASLKNQSTLQTFMSSSLKVSKAELMYVMYLVEHDEAFLHADHFTPLAPIMFTDSEIAKNFKCSRTKATVLAKEVIAPHIKENIVQQVKEATHYSVLLDETTDRNTIRQLAIVIRYVTFDANAGLTVQTKVLDLVPCNKATGQNLFDCLMNSLASTNLIHLI